MLQCTFQVPKLASNAALTQQGYKTWSKVKIGTLFYKKPL